MFPAEATRGSGDRSASLTAPNDAQGAHAQTQRPGKSFGTYAGTAAAAAAAAARSDTPTPSGGPRAVTPAGVRCRALDELGAAACAASKTCPSDRRSRWLMLGCMPRKETAGMLTLGTSSRLGTTWHSDGTLDCRRSLSAQTARHCPNTNTDLDLGWFREEEPSGIAAEDGTLRPVRLGPLCTAQHRQRCRR